MKNPVRDAIANLDGLSTRWRRPLGSAICGPAKAQCASELEAAVGALKLALLARYGATEMIVQKMVSDIFVLLSEVHPRDACADAECSVCSIIVCPHHEPLHFHHDGCPSCRLLQ